jgi:hypothetical protein
VVSCGNLRAANVVSCGCYKDRIILPPKEAGRRAAKRHYLKGAKERGFCWELPDALFFQLLEQKCNYCGEPPSNQFNGAFHKFKYNGIDRVDSFCGYTPDNVVSCCGPCNRMKLQLTREQFLARIEKIYSYSIEPIYSLAYAGDHNAA